MNVKFFSIKDKLIIASAICFVLCSYFAYLTFIEGEYIWLFGNAFLAGYQLSFIIGRQNYLIQESLLDEYNTRESANFVATIEQMDREVDLLTIQNDLVEKNHQLRQELAAILES